MRHHWVTNGSGQRSKIKIVSTQVDKDVSFVKVIGVNLAFHTHNRHIYNAPKKMELL